MRRQRTLIISAAALALLLPPLVAKAAQADPVVSVTSISPNQFGDPTVTPVHIVGTGMSTGDTVQARDVTFSQVVSDGAGGLNAVATVNGVAIGTLTVTSADGLSSTSCSCVVSTNSGPIEPRYPDEYPMATSLGLDWLPVDFPPEEPGSYLITWTPPGGITHSMSVAGTSATIPSLTPATPYLVTIAGQFSDEVGDAVGRATELTEEVGLVPDPPTIVGSSPCCDSDQVTASGQSWQIQGASSYSFTFTPRSGTDRTPTTDPNSGMFQEYQDFNPAGVTVTATATNSVGTSLPSAPIVVKPIVSSAPIRHEQYRFTRGVLTVTWQPPANTGNSAVEDYHVVIRHNHQRLVTTTTGLSYQMRLSAGSTFQANIRPKTEAGLGGRLYNEFGSAYVDVVTALNRHGGAKWRHDDTGGRWHSLGGHFATPPAVFMRANRVLTFVGADRSGHAVVRTLATPWRSLSPTPCLRPTATWGALGVDIACRAANGTLEISTRTPLHDGLPHVGASDWVASSLHIVGGPHASSGSGYSGLIIVRTAPWDSAGDDLRTYDTFNEGIPPLHFGRLHLACTGAISTSSLRTALVACRTGGHTIAWRDIESGLGHGVISTAYRTVGVIGLAASDAGEDNRLAVTDPQGEIHIVDINQHLQWRLGKATTAGLGATCIAGCDPRNL